MAVFSQMLGFRTDWLQLNRSQRQCFKNRDNPSIVPRHILRAMYTIHRSPTSYKSQPPTKDMRVCPKARIYGSLPLRLLVLETDLHAAYLGAKRSSLRPPFAPRASNNSRRRHPQPEQIHLQPASYAPKNRAVHSGFLTGFDIGPAAKESFATNVPTSPEGVVNLTGGPPG
ncbi:uncharacterized protein BDV17DRAFT_291279 [Aspergillus undulatus]|uniref:uncharacterized protein n=1 Tax=Aspergillus undulatus TaxID=1810928 RepID=UPI003CCD1FE3